MNIVVLGGGPGGYVAAIRAAMLGANVTVIEKQWIGGTCLHAGCIPTKSLLASSDILSQIKGAGRYGISVPSGVEMDFQKVMKRKDQIVTQITSGVKMLLAARNITVLEGVGTVADDKTVIVKQADGETVKLTPDRLILATGSLPVVPSLFPFDAENIITSNEALDLEEAPKSMIIVGGGVIGCELGQFFADCGTKITIVEAMPRLLPSEDKDVSDVLNRAMRRRKINMYTGQSVTECTINDQGVAVSLEDGTKIEAEKLLVSVGRKANITGLGLEDIGIDIENGKVVVNKHMETSVKGIYAIGDMVDSPFLAHMASKEGTVAADNAMGKESIVKYHAVPRCVYTEPEIACVGKTEQELKEADKPYKIGKYNLAGLGKAKAAGKIDGFVKVLADENDVLIGAAIVGQHGTELLTGLTMAIELGLNAEEIGNVIFPHPTLSEGIMEAIHDINKQSVHSVYQ